MAKIITGIDFDYQSVKIIQVKKIKDKFILLKFACERVVSEDDDKIAQLIGEILKKNKIKPINLYTCINRRFTTVRYLELPSIDQEEIKQMVKFQVGKFLPYPIQELIIGIQLIAKYDNFSQIMVVVVHKDIVNKHIEILKRINLEPDKILFSSQAIFNSCYNSQYQDSSMAIIDIGSLSTEIDFINKNRLSFSRSSTLNLDTNWEENLINEIKISIKAYKNEIKNAKDIQKVILSGNIHELKNLDKKLTNELDVNVEINQPLKRLIITPKLRKMYRLVEENPQLATVIGLVLTDKEVIDLLPEDIKGYKKQKERRKNLILTLILISLLALLLVMFIERKIFDTYQYLTYLNKELTTNLPLVKQVELKKKRLKVIKKEIINKTLSIEIIAEIYKLIPQDIFLNELVFEEDTTTIIRGEAKNMASVFSLITILENSTYFKNVKVNYATKRKVSEKEVADFQITCQLEK